MGENRLSMPGEIEPLSIGFQDEKLCLWCLVQPTATIYFHYFFAAATGQSLPTERLGSYVGTAQLDWFVVHVFEISGPILPE
jgi:hypothetical protein